MVVDRSALEVAAESLQQHDWEQALQSGEAAWRAGDPGGLEISAAAGWWLDREQSVFEAREELFRYLRSNREPRAAARVATQISWDYTIFRREPVVAQAWAARARSLIGDGESVDHVMLLIREATLDRDVSVVIEKLESAITASRRVGSFDAESLARTCLGIVLVSAGRIREGFTLLDESVGAACAGELSDPVSVTSACCQVLAACSAVGDFDRARQWIPKIEALAERKNLKSLLVMARCRYVPLLVSRGEHPTAEQILSEALRYYEQRLPGFAGMVLVELAELRRQQGRSVEAERLLDRAAPYPDCHLVRARLALQEGSLDLAVDHAACFLRNVAFGQHLRRAMALGVLGRAQAALGHGPEASAALEELKKLASKLSTPTADGILESTRAAVLSASGNRAEAIAALWDAIDKFAAGKAPYEEARCRLELADLLDGAGRDQEAASQRAAAVAMLARQMTPQARGGGLTRREREVAALITEGLSDAAIAAQLHLSPHTVHRHVANIRRRLGAPTRAAAVARAREQGLV